MTSLCSPNSVVMIFIISHNYFEIFIIFIAFFNILSNQNLLQIFDYMNVVMIIMINNQNLSEAYCATIIYTKIENGLFLYFKNMGQS